MICSVGAPRTGTSLIMQSLVHLGIESVAPAFLPEHKLMRSFNPGGFYEFNSEEGIQHDGYKGKAIKLFGAQLLRTDRNLIHKLIWVQRDRQEAINSYEAIRPYLPYSGFTSETIYDSNIECIKHYAMQSAHIVQLEEIKNHPDVFVYDLIKYLQINPTGSQADSAIQNIK